MLTPDEIEWLGKKLDAIERRQAEMLNTMKHVNEKAQRIVDVDKALLQFRLDMLELCYKAIRAGKEKEKIDADMDK